ncbi:MAG: type II toxin-antitoxin system HicB family antitoxin [Dehalococcoidia bacterium]|nr:type II toxin-antitoxin system HicB family antitoxin [Dehalococcoidia bacterium]
MQRPRNFTVVIEQDDEGYLVASVPDLPGCHTQARSLDELLKRVREAISLCLEEQGQNVKVGLRLVGVHQVVV